MKTLILSLIPLAFIGFATPASAQPVAAKTAVSTAGLDLATVQGARSLDLRILHAASALCGTPSPADLRGRAKYEQCRDEARATASAGRDRSVELASRGGVLRLASGR